MEMGWVYEGRDWFYVSHPITVSPTRFCRKRGLDAVVLLRLLGHWNYEYDPGFYPDVQTIAFL